MISDGETIAFERLQLKNFDVFFYGLGFESRSTKIIASLPTPAKIFALQMPASNLHAYARNLQFARTKHHRVIVDFQAFLSSELPKLFEKRVGPLRIGFDVSSVNRLMLIGLLNELALLVQVNDSIELFYCPAAYFEPKWLFPQIEKLGPVDSLLSGFNSDPSKPLCLIFGMGFEAGVSMGIISHLEPSVAYGLWGTGIDERFSDAVKRANFNFQFPGFNTRILSYSVRDPKGAFELLENVVYGLTRDHRVIIVPMGPKLFTALAALVGMKYFGDAAVWRVQHSIGEQSDSFPGESCVAAILDVSLLKSYAERVRAFTKIAI